MFAGMLEKFRGDVVEEVERWLLSCESREMAGLPGFLWEAARKGVVDVGPAMEQKNPGRRRGPMQNPAFTSLSLAVAGARARARARVDILATSIKLKIKVEGARATRLAGGASSEESGREEPECLAGPACPASERSNGCQRTTMMTMVMIPR